MYKQNNMQLFYTPEIVSDIIFLTDEESAHCRKVLRLKEGSPLSLTDGKGNLYRGEIIDISGKQCSVQIVETIPNYGKHDFYLHIAIAPTKNIDRLEWFLEKAVEIGVDEITPVLCDHSERTIIKPERLEKILIAAMKQSLKTYLPKLNAITPFNNLMNIPFTGKKMIAYCNDEHRIPFQSTYTKGDNALVSIGPEGDFSEPEIAKALASGFVPVTLGNTRLRTETAGVVAVAYANFINQFN